MPVAELAVAVAPRTVSIVVAGIAAPAGSKSAFPNRKTGGVSVRDSSKRAKPWQAVVASAAKDAFAGALLAGPLHLEIVFVLPRPKGHYGTGRNAATVRPSAPIAPDVKPDLTKLVRGVEDALTGLVWRDDGQVVSQHTSKIYGEPAECRIDVSELHAVPVL